MENKIKNIEKSISLTPKQKEIEIIIIKNKMDEREANILRLMSAMNESMKSTLHYCHSHYIDHLINSAEQTILDLELVPLKVKNTDNPKQ